MAGVHGRAALTIGVHDRGHLGREGHPMRMLGIRPSVRFPGSGHQRRRKRRWAICTLNDSRSQMMKQQSARICFVERVSAMSMSPTAVLQLPYLRLHQAVYRLSGGLVGKHAGLRPALLLTTKGRRSGAPRTVALIYADEAMTSLWWPQMEAASDTLAGTTM